MIYTINIYLRLFQHKILNKKLYLNKKLHNFGLSNAQLCSFCKLEEGTISHLLHYWTHKKNLASGSGLFH